jgi:hypothetical protein
MNSSFTLLENPAIYSEDVEENVHSFIECEVKAPTR